MQKFSIHTHTVGYDGKNTVAEMIQHAIKLKWEAIGISNHIEFHENLPLFHSMFFSDYHKAKEQYKRTINEIKELAAKENIQVLAGFEVDFFKGKKWRHDFEALLKEIECDYLIGSTHCLYNEDESIIMHLYDYTRPKVPNKEFIDSYWINIKEAIKSGYFDMIAHIDLIKRFGLDKEEYKEDKIEIAELLSKYKVSTELNTGNYDKNKMFYPSDELLKILKDYDVPIMISDDAHSIEALGQNFSHAEQLLTQMQYTKRITVEDLKL